jgi:hypothetical protein
MSDDDNTQTNNEAIPTTSQPDQASGDVGYGGAGSEGGASDAGSYLVDKVVSTGQYLKMLMGREGMFDSLVNDPSSLVRSINTEGAGATTPTGTPPANQEPDFLTKAVRGAGNAFTGGYTGEGAEDANQGVTTGPQQAPGAAAARPGAPARPQAPSAASPAALAQSNVGLPQFQPQQPQRPETDYEKQVRVFGKDNVEAATQAFPMVGQGRQRMDWLLKQREQSTKDAAALDRTKATGDWHSNVATIAAQASESRANVHAMAATERGRMALQGVIYKANEVFRSEQQKAYLKTIDATLGIGGKLSDEQAGIMQMVAQKIKEAEQGQQQNQQASFGAPSPGAAGGKKPPAGWVKTTPVTGDQVNTQ